MQPWFERKFKLKLIEWPASQNRFLLFLFISVFTLQMVGELTYSRPINGEIFFWTDHDGMIIFLFPPPLSLSLSLFPLLYPPFLCSCQLDIDWFAWFNKGCSRYTFPTLPESLFYFSITHGCAITINLFG